MHSQTCEPEKLFPAMDPQARFIELSASITVLAERADATTDLARLLAIRREAERVRADADRIVLALSSSGDVDATRSCLRTVKLTGLAMSHIAARIKLAKALLKRSEPAAAVLE